MLASLLLCNFTYGSFPNRLLLPSRNLQTAPKTPTFQCANPIPTSLFKCEPARVLRRRRELWAFMASFPLGYNSFGEFP